MWEALKAGFSVSAADKHAATMAEVRREALIFAAAVVGAGLAYRCGTGHGRAVAASGDVSVALLEDGLRQGGTGGDTGCT